MRKISKWGGTFPFGAEKFPYQTLFGADPPLTGLIMINLVNGGSATNGLGAANLSAPIRENPNQIGIFRTK